MRKFISLFFLLIFFAGCKSSFKSNFRDFNAYYNTFYNAKKSYNLGLDKSLTQPRRYNTLQPLRVYETPLGAGGPDFDNAIEKGANILRKYKETKWVDDALEIIGKSYYYRMEYFAADQKFDELYITSESNEMKQRAVFWKGRVLYEFQAHSQGIQYLTEQLALFGDNWNNDLEHQVNVLLAEHYVALENWVGATDLLNQSLSEIPGRENKERGFYLLGQLNEILGDSEGAFEAYDRVEKYYSVYELQFEAKKKKAEVARVLGNSKEAYDVFSDMVRDDKNTEFVAELNYELGKTEQDRGNFEEAEEVYLSILRDRINKITPETKALVYYELAEIHRYYYNDFTIAAAYYDSSASINIPVEQLPDYYQADELSNSFGQYASVRFQIYEQDSLLWLGGLSPEAFDSVISEIQERMIEEMERQRREQEERNNTMINLDPTGEDVQTTDVGSNGFLNIKNPILIADAREQFQARWGNRPLVDNWRVDELIVTTFQDDSTLVNNSAQGGNNTTQEEMFTIDISRVPFTPHEQDSVRDEIAHLNYELGNLFFLSLNLPDSAEYYFLKAIREQPESDIVPISLYSLTELYAIEGNEEDALSYSRELVLKYPYSIYADRLIEKYGIERPTDSTLGQNVQQNPTQIYLALSGDNDLGYFEQAKALSSFSTNYPEEEISERALYESIQNYIRVARTKPNFDDTLATWQTLNNEWQLKKSEFQAQQETARISLADTNLTISVSDSLKFVEIIDSTLIEPNFEPYFPYNGEYWDSTRTAIATFNNLFSGSEFHTAVRKIEAEIKLPEVEEEAPELVEEEGVETELSERNDEGYTRCEDVEEELRIRGGLNNFNSILNVPDNNEDAAISYLFYVNERGVVDNYELVSDTENDRLITAYNNAIESFVSFEPVLIEGVASPVSCIIEFEIPEN